MDATTASLTLHQLRELYLQHAESYYRRRSGEPTREHLNVKGALDRFITFAGPAALAAKVNRHQVRSWVDQLAAEGLSRAYVNQSLTRVRRWVQWAATRELVPYAVTEDLRRVMPIRAFRSKAKEAEVAPPPPLLEMEKLLPYLAQPGRDVLHLTMLTGARASELLELTNGEVLNDEHGPRIVPTQHKSAHHGHLRIIPLCPAALAIVGRWWRPLLPDDPLFESPRRARLRHYTIDGFRAAMKRACRKAGVPTFSPRAVRRAVARHVREHRGLDAAQALLGHASADTTELYAPLTPGQAEALRAARRATEVL